MKYEFKIGLMNMRPELIIIQRCDCEGVIDTIYGIYEYSLSEINPYRICETCFSRLLKENS